MDDIIARLSVVALYRWVFYMFVVGIF